MLEILNEQEFNQFAKTHPYNTFFQSSYWGELKSKNGWIPHLVGIKKQGKIVGATLLLSKQIPILRHYFFYAPRGFLIDYNDTQMVVSFTAQIVKYVKHHKGIFFKINPYLMYQERDIDGNIVKNGKNNKHIVTLLKKLGYQHNGFTTTYGKDLEPRWISVLDIKGKTEEEILKNMRTTTRTGIQNSYQHGLQLIEADESRLEEFKKLMVHTGERRGFIDRPLSYYQNMYQYFYPNKAIKIMLVELNTDKYKSILEIEKEQVEEKIEVLKNATGAKGKRQLKEYLNQLQIIHKKINEMTSLKEKNGSCFPIAGGLFMTFGTQVLSLFGASYKEYMKYDGQYFLNNEMIKYAIHNHFETYNFYGITGEFNENSPMFGLFDFKRGFHSNVVELIGEFTYVTNRIYYLIYQILFSIYKKLKKWRNHS